MDQAKAIYMGEKLREYLVIQLFFSFLFFPPFLLQQLRECCRGCLTPFPFSHAKLLLREERRSLTRAPARLRPPHLPQNCSQWCFSSKQRCSSLRARASRSIACCARARPNGIINGVTEKGDGCGTCPTKRLFHTLPLTCCSLLLVFAPQEMAACLVCPAPAGISSISSTSCTWLHVSGAFDERGWGIWGEEPPLTQWMNLR